MARRPRKPRTVFKRRRNVGVPKLGNISLGLPQDSPRPSTDTSNLQPVTPSPRPSLKSESASKTKLGDIDNKYSVYSSDSNVNIIVDLGLLTDALSKSVKCAECDAFGIEVKNTSNIGLASSLEIFCNKCGYSYSFMSSNKMPTRNLYDINVRLVYGLRSIGKGHAGATTLCGFMNLPPPPAKFMPYVEVLGSSVEDVCLDSMKKAVEHAVELNEGVRDIPVAIDGTWQTRGFKSLNGVVTATSFDSGEVIDAEILTKSCYCTDRLSGIHLPTCTANYQGSSGGMEVQGAKEIFSRSVSTYNARYVEYLGDGDSKGFASIQQMNPYGDDCPVKKLECVGHVQKRMGTRLRRLKNENKSLKLSDNKGLGGQGRLTSSTIDILQTYYGQAIRKNSNNLEQMRQAIWAIYYHKISTDSSPHHELCPKGKESWCKYQVAAATGGTYNHKNNIPQPIMEFIKPVFKDLSEPELLRRCLHGKTQNPNESVNNVIWSRLPKTGFVGIKTLHVGVYDAIATLTMAKSQSVMF